MALYTSEEVDALHVLLAPEPGAATELTLELSERLHVDLVPRDAFRFAA